MELSIYGGTGFVGNAFVRKYAINTDSIHLIGREETKPVLNDDILYLISTVDNYNVFTDPTLDVRTNLLKLTEVLEHWKESRSRGVFNFVSSWFVYGPNTELPAKEDAACDPRGFYSITKRAAEQLVISFCETFDMKYRILRLGNVLGADDAKVSAKKNALQYLFNEMKEGRGIEIYEGGDFYRSYIYIEDCIDAIHKVLEAGKLNEIYNIATTEKMKFINMLQYAGDLLSFHGEYRFVPQKDFHKQVQAKSFYMDVSKLYDLGFQHRYDPEHMIEAVLFPHK